MKIFKKQKRIEIIIGTSVLVLAITISLLYIFFKEIPTIQEYNEYLITAKEANELKEIEIIEQMILFSKSLILLISGTILSFSNIIDSILFRSFSRIIPKKLLFISIILESEMASISLIMMLVFKFNIAGIIIGLIFVAISLGITFLLFWYATRAKAEYF